ncbi:glycosyltransferase [Pseudomonas sp. CF161]|uniref:glycosyltransferase n=1 Tax=Pseudomonas sp. CF161 TaxID=911241 RepID=UPI00042281D1|nr:glycosyltransferase [Pseudomonas sp. CF161]
MVPNLQKKIRIITFVSYYFPGFKAGGPLRTISNMVDNLSDVFEFWIITRDRDLDDSEAYPQVTTNTWQQVGHANVFYMSPDQCTVWGMIKILQSTPHEVVYLNSFFDPVFTMKSLLACKTIKSASKAVIVAPRGEFSPEALRLKKLKKRIYLSFFSWLYKDVTFQVSSAYEKYDLLQVLPWAEEDTIIAMDLPAQTDPIFFFQSIKSRAQLPPRQQLKLVFLSRISPMKNLDYALAVLSAVKTPIVFDIYGPKEDPAYWAACDLLIKELPDNIMVNYCGSILPKQVKSTFAKYDLFFFPTRGENYGHVIAEAISVGTPVLLSDQTPWRNLEQDGLGWDLPLVAPSAFAETIDHFAQFTIQEREAQRKVVYKNAIVKLTDQSAVEANKELFFSAIRSRGE